MQKAAFAVLVVLGAASLAPAQCPPMGLGLNAAGDRMGDPFAIHLLGTPSVSGLLGIDVSGGPTSTPIGTVCLGLTPATLFSPFTLDGLGSTAFTGILPALPYLTGLTGFLQAGAADGTQPGGLALSNGSSLALRPPRLFIIDPGMPPGLSTPPSPGSFCVHDALADIVITAVVPLASHVVDAVAIPSLGLLAILLGDSSLAVFDADSTAPILSMPLPLSPGAPSKLAVDGSTLLVMNPGMAPSPFGPGVPGAVRTFSLPSGMAGLTVSLASGNPSDLLALQGTGLAYLRVQGTVVPMDLISGTLFPAIDLVPGSSGAISEWRLVGNTLYCLMPGSLPNPFGGGGAPPAINAVDTTTHTALFPAAIALGGVGPGTTLRYGPAGAGNALFVHLASIPGLVHVSPATLMVNGTIPVAGGFTTMELSDGGSEYLMLCKGLGCGGAPILQTMDPLSFAITTVTPTGAVQPKIHVLPSATMNKAYLVAGTSTLAPISTDPTVPASGVVGLPVSSGALRVVVD